MCGRFLHFLHFLQLYSVHKAQLDSIIIPLLELESNRGDIIDIGVIRMPIYPSLSCDCISGSCSASHQRADGSVQDDNDITVQLNSALQTLYNAVQIASFQSPSHSKYHFQFNCIVHPRWLRGCFGRNSSSPFARKAPCPCSRIHHTTKNNTGSGHRVALSVQRRCL